MKNFSIKIIVCLLAASPILVHAQESKPPFKYQTLDPSQCVSFWGFGSGCADNQTCVADAAPNTNRQMPKCMSSVAAQAVNYYDAGACATVCGYACTRNPDSHNPTFYCDASKAPAPPTTPTTPPVTQPSSLEFTPLAPIPGLTDTITSTSAVNEQTLAGFLQNLYKYLIGLAAIIAVIMIIWGGLLISTESVTKKTEGKQHIYDALLGLVLVLCPVLVFSVINPQILNLSLALPELKTPKTTTGNPNQPGAGTVDNTTGCVVKGVRGILEIANCQTKTAATTWGQTCTDGRLIVKEKTVVNPSNGVEMTINVATCSTKKPYLFIDKRSWYNISGAINGMAPIVKTSDNPNNGSEAVQFENICKNSNPGWRTCISDIPFFTDATPCGLTGASANTTWSCYKQTLSCEDRDSSTKCDVSPNWVPFQ